MSFREAPKDESMRNNDKTQRHSCVNWHTYARTKKNCDVGTALERSAQITSGEKVGMLKLVVLDRNKS